MPPIENSRFRFFATGRVIFTQSLFFALALILTTSPLCADDQGLVSPVRSSILALDSARQTALSEIEELSLSPKEVSDYKDFIVYLNTRIFSYCRELAEQGGTAALEGLPCPTMAMGTGVKESPPPSEEQIYYTTGTIATETRTQTEKTEALDGDFLAALGVFDEMLLKEEDKIAARVPSQRESGAAGSAGRSGGAGESREAGETGEAGEPGSGDNSSDAANGKAEGQADQAETAPGTQSNAGAGDSDVDHSAYGAPGGKLPPPEDDDIVARQLREAAEKEPDPELKKKLWEEYWKYKGVRK